MFYMKRTGAYTVRGAGAVFIWEIPISKSGSLLDAKLLAQHKINQFPYTMIAYIWVDSIHITLIDSTSIEVLCTVGCVACAVPFSSIS